MPYTKEQLRTYWATNKVILNQRRKDKRRLAKLGLAILKEVSHDQSLKVSQVSPGQVSHYEVSHNAPEKISQVSQLNAEKVSHEEVSHQVRKVSHNSSEQVSHLEVSQLTTNPYLTKLIQAWQTQTNYNCPPPCSHSYCANCVIRAAVATEPEPT
ncbi:12904_t:CDS:2, partial [Funneliformis geosporum]